MATLTGSAAITGSGLANVAVYSLWTDRPAFMIDGAAVTDHGRQSSFTVEDSSVQIVRTANGYRNTFYPANSKKMTFSINWQLLPDTSVHTSDGRGGRLALKPLASRKSVILLYVKKPDRTGYDKYNVYVSKYDESLVMRRNFDGGVLYNVSMEFVEL